MAKYILMKTEGRRKRCGLIRCALPALVLLLCLSGVSCKKFLAERSQSDFTPKTTESYSELLMGTGYPLSTGRLQRALCLMDDDIQEYPPLVADGVGISPQQGLPAYAWQPDFFQGMEASGFDVSGLNIDGYKNYYSLVMGANVALQYTPGSQGTQSDRDYLMGQAYALRAFYYLQLVNLYGRPYNDSTITPDKSPGVPLMLTANVSDSMPPRSTVAQVYSQIQSDLNNAFSRLDGEQRTGDIYRMDHISAHLLASRVALYMCNWDSVISYASYVIRYHPQLMDLNSWFPRTYDASGNPVFIPVIGAGNAETLWTYGNNYESYPGNVIDAYSMSQDLINQFDATDLRAQIYFTSLPPFFSQWLSILTQPTKWMDVNLLNSSITGCAFRSSEAYLNRAEACAQKYIETGNTDYEQRALDDLNTLRAKRYAPADFQPVQAMPADSLLRFCRNERRRELFMEGQRWFDLRRYGMPSITHQYGLVQGSAKTYTLQAHDPQYTLQIPPTAILLNQNLVQNPAGPERNAQ